MDTISSVSYGGGLVKATDLTTQSGMKDKQEEIMQKYIEENMKKLVGGEMSDINEVSISIYPYYIVIVIFAIIVECTL